MKTITKMLPAIHCMWVYKPVLMAEREGNPTVLWVLYELGYNSLLDPESFGFYFYGSSITVAMLETFEKILLL
jgi:hypothetical protein